MRTILTFICFLVSFSYASAQGSSNPLTCYYDQNLNSQSADAIGNEYSLGDKQARQVNESGDYTYYYVIFDWVDGTSCPPTLPKYSRCESKVAWMLGAWQSNTFYAQNGVDGSVQSIRRYLSEVEDFCPRS